MTFKKTLLLILLAEMLIALLAIYNYGFAIDGLHATTRFSGRFSLVIFSLIFICLTYKPVKLSLFLSTRPFHIFAIAHGIHLVELLSFVYLSKANVVPLRLAGGFLAYVFIFVMPFLQVSFDKGKLSQKKYLVAVNVYLFYAWFIFFMTYLPRVQGKLPNVGGSYREFVVLFSWVCLLMIMRMISWFTAKPKMST